MIEPVHSASTAAASSSSTTPPRPVSKLPKRHQVSGKEKYLRMALRDQLKANFHSHGGAFDRLRDRLCIKSATTKSRELFSVLYQSCVDQIVTQMLIEADYKRKRTLTMDMATHAFERITGQKIYAMDYGARRVQKHSHHSNRAKVEVAELGVSRSLKTAKTSDAKPEAKKQNEAESEAENEQDNEQNVEDVDMPEA